MFKKILATAAVALISAGTANAAPSFPDFVVDKNFTGATAGTGTFTADKITGTYTEVISFGIGGPGTFGVSIVWYPGQFAANDGTTPVIGSGLGGTYQLYGLLMGQGTVSTVGTVTSFTLTSGNVELWADKGVDSNYTPAVPVTGGVNPWVINPGATADTLLATGSTIAPSGGKLDLGPTCVGGINCGSFGQANTIALTAAGQTFFTMPVNFYNAAFESGQLNSFLLTGTQTINGSMDLVFGRIPEPASLALIGVGLFGMGLARRRRS